MADGGKRGTEREWIPEKGVSIEWERASEQMNVRPIQTLGKNPHAHIFCTKTKQRKQKQQINSI